MKRIAIVGVIVAGIIGLSTLPDRDLELYRAVDSKLSPDRIWRQIEAPNRWSQWFKLSATIPQGEELVENGFLHLKLDPKKGFNRKFELTAKVLSLVPEKKLELQITEDSSGKLTRLFSDLRWEIEIEPKGAGSVIHAHVRGHTRHWRSRIFGLIAERIIMNQSFYPDVLQLSTLRQPFDVSDGTPNIPSLM